jgi:hypothetical protein
LRTTRIAPFVTPLATMLLAVGPLLAQATNPPTVPLELVQTLALSPFAEPGTTPDVLVGRLPDRIAHVVPLPADGRIIGSLVFRQHAVSAVAVSGPARALLDTLAARLIAAGWTEHQAPRAHGFASTGNVRPTYCLGDSVSLSTSTMRRSAEGRYVLFISAEGHAAFNCRDLEGETSRPLWHGPELIPSLTPPEGSYTNGGGTGGGSDEEYARARIRTDLTTTQVLDHYDAQLRAAGWTPVQRVAADDAAVATYRVTDSQGAVWHGVLTATMPAPSSAPSPRFLSLRLLRVDSAY